MDKPLESKSQKKEWFIRSSPPTKKDIIKKYPDGGTSQTFCFLDPQDPTIKIRAASFVPFFRLEGRLHFLLIFVTHKNRDSLQTIGGRVEKNDFHWRHTALREFGEESGWTIDSKEFCGLLSQQDKGQSFVYSERSKHIFWFHEVPDEDFLREKWKRIDHHNIHYDEFETPIQKFWYPLEKNEIYEKSGQRALEPYAQRAIRFFESSSFSSFSSRSPSPSPSSPRSSPPSSSSSSRSSSPSSSSSSYSRSSSYPSSSSSSSRFSSYSRSSYSPSSSSSSSRSSYFRSPYPRSSSYSRSSPYSRSSSYPSSSSSSRSSPYSRSSSSSSSSYSRSSPYSRSSSYPSSSSSSSRSSSSSYPRSSSSSSSSSPSSYYYPSSSPSYSCTSPYSPSSSSEE